MRKLFLPLLFIAASAFGQSTTDPNHTGIGGAGGGTVTNVACSGVSGIACTVTGPTGAASITVDATNATVSTATVAVTAAKATALSATHTISITGDLTYTSPGFDGSGNVTAAGTLASVAAGGTCTSCNLTVDVKGRITALASGSSGSTFTPAALFANGEKGAWYDPSDLTTVFTDSACTLAGSVGQPVGCIKDKSGNHFDLTGTLTLRPTLSQDGGGNYYLLFDGVANYLYYLPATAIPLKNHMVSFAMQELTHTDNGGFLQLAPAAGNDYNSVDGLGYEFGTGAVSMSALSNQENVPFYGISFPNDGIPMPLQVITEHGSFGGNGQGTMANTFIRSNGIQYGAGVAVQNQTSVTGGGILLGTRFLAGVPNAGFVVNMRVYGVVVLGRQATGTEIRNTEAWLGSKSGLAL